MSDVFIRNEREQQLVQYARGLSTQIEKKRQLPMMNVENFHLSILKF